MFPRVVRTEENIKQVKLVDDLAERIEKNISKGLYKLDESSVSGFSCMVFYNLGCQIRIENKKLKIYQNIYLMTGFEYVVMVFRESEMKIVFHSNELTQRVANFIPEEDILTFNQCVHKYCKHSLYARNRNNKNNFPLNTIIIRTIIIFRIKETDEQLNKFKYPVNINERNLRIETRDDVTMVKHSDPIIHKRLLELFDDSIETRDCFVIPHIYNRLGLSYSAMIIYYCNLMTKQ
jgi:hypothetical protein